MAYRKCSEELPPEGQSEPTAGEQDELDLRISQYVDLACEIHDDLMRDPDRRHQSESLTRKHSGRRISLGR